MLHRANTARNGITSTGGTVHEMRPRATHVIPPCNCPVTHCPHQPQHFLNYNTKGCNYTHTSNFLHRYIDRLRFCMENHSNCQWLFSHNAVHKYHYSMFVSTLNAITPPCITWINLFKKKSRSIHTSFVQQNEEYFAYKQLTKCDCSICALLSNCTEEKLTKYRKVITPSLR